MGKHPAINLACAEGWMHLDADAPRPADAMVLKDDEDAEGHIDHWMGVVMGQFRGQKMPVLVMSALGHVSLVPLVDNGVDFSDEVVWWAPWPKISFPLNLSSILGSGN